VVAANGIYKLAVLGTVQGQQHISTLHFRSTANPNNTALSEPAYMQAILNTWQAQAMVPYRAMFMTIDSPIESYQVRKVCGSLPLPAGLDVAQGAGNTAGTRPSTGLGEALAPWLAAVVTQITGFAGRSYRGRWFFGGMAEADIAGPSVLAAHTTLVQSYCDGVRVAFIAPAEVDATAKLFVYSKLLAAVPGTQCQNAGADVVQLTPKTLLATMKSRKAGHGR
jgi:hypothetical protein